MLKFGGEEAFEVVLDEEDAKEFRIAKGTENVPGKGREAEAGDRDRMKATKSVAPASPSDKRAPAASSRTPQGVPPAA